MSTYKKVIGIGASILSDVSVPFTEIIADELNLPYEEYSDRGISNDAIFRFISQANIKYSNCLIIVLFTYLYRHELVNSENQIFSTNVHQKDMADRKIITEYYLKYIFNDSLASINFWNRLYDSKLSVTTKNNTLISIWDDFTGYDVNIKLETIYDKFSFVEGNKFKKIVLDNNCFTDSSFSNWLRLNNLSGHDGHGSLIAHKKFASILLGPKNDK